MLAFSLMLDNISDSSGFFAQSPFQQVQMHSGSLLQFLLFLSLPRQLLFHQKFSNLYKEETPPMKVIRAAGF